ncbi:MAG: hypothetical protein BGO59_08540 [Spirosoma sp. 48-14]|nr:MAG: hypothetical protein BGO59_08540 [Spirosoma sp. 48-14]
MVFSLSVLQQYLLTKHGILPERVGWHTQFGHDLGLNQSDIQCLVEEIIQLMNGAIYVDTDHHLNEVLDLAMYVLLRSNQELTRLPDSDLTFSAYLSKLPSSATSDCFKFSPLACHTGTCRNCFSTKKSDGEYGT